MAGYEVLAVADGADASRWCGRQQMLAFTHVDLVLLDHVRPVRGFEVAEWIKTMQPPVVVLLHTGDPDLWNTTPPYVDGVLPKPTGPRELVQERGASSGPTWH